MLPAAHAVLDMAALTHNLARLRERAPRSKIMAVIKANAYGHGAIRVARTLREADAFAVARVDEGMALREAGIRQRIVVLQGFICQEELELHARYGLEPVVHALIQVSLLENTRLEKPVTVWLKLDTGMHRLGLNAEEFEDGHRRLSACSSVFQPLALMTHLANADVLSDPVTGRQLDLFRDNVVKLPGECSIANSAGLLAWENAQVDWVRPGIALYGASPFPHRTGHEDGLKPVMTLRTRLIAIKHLKVGDAIGYGGDWVCHHPTRLGVAAIGYGDGYPRHARPGTPVLVCGQRVPLIGRVSMDMITIDLSECPQAVVGDAVTLWGAGLPVEEIARHADTIPYVLLCKVTPRVKIIEI
ncbi:MAG: alanine racemase [Methylococcaceae bacterium]|nr:alanine racemase [Methylococcaceae bacterium]